MIVINSQELTTAPSGMYPKNLILEPVFKNEFIVFLQIFYQI